MTPEVAVVILIIVIAALGSSKFSGGKGGGDTPTSPKFGGGGGGGGSKPVKGKVACQLGLRAGLWVISEIRAKAFGGAELPTEIDGVKLTVRNLGSQVPSGAWSLWRFPADASIVWPDSFDAAPAGGELVASSLGPLPVIDAVQGAIAGCAATGQWGACPSPTGWDASSNALWVSPGCDCVLEGAMFEPASRGQKTISAIEEPTLAEVLAAAPDNSVYGFVDYLMNVENYSTPEEIVERILVEANGVCADVPHDQRPPALQQWHASLVERIRPWIETQTIGFTVGAA